MSMLLCYHYILLLAQHVLVSCHNMSENGKTASLNVYLHYNDTGMTVIISSRKQ